MNGEAFLAYIERCLAPTLKRRDIVAIDNSPSTRSPACRRPSRLPAQSCALPATVFAGVQPDRGGVPSLDGMVRKAAERTIKGLERRVGSFIPALHPSECIGYFRHAGYEPL